VTSGWVFVKIKKQVLFATQAYRVIRREGKGFCDAEISKKPPLDGEAV